MKQIFTNSINSLKFINLIILTLILSSCDDNKTHFTVTADTVIKPGSEISKYVTQEEVDDFSFRYWDIDDNKTYQEKNTTLIPLRNSLKLKDSKAVIAFLKDNNVSVNIKMRDGTTPLMYSSFYNDVNTTKELINLGANLRAKDKYGLSPLAYAIENNSTKTAKILVDNKVSVDEIEFVQFYLYTRNYGSIDYLVIDADNIELKFSDAYGTNNKNSKDAINPLAYSINLNLLEMTEIILESGYKPEVKKYDYRSLVFVSDKYDIMFYIYLINYPNYELMLDLMIKYSVPGQPSKEMMEKEYDECHNRYISSIISAYDVENEKYFIKYETLHKNLYQKYCSDKNGKFKDIKEFISFLNEQNKMKLLEEYIYSEKKDNLVFKNNQTKFIIKPYKALNSDEIKSIVNEYYKSKNK